MKKRSSNCQLFGDPHTNNPFYFAKSTAVLTLILFTQKFCLCTLTSSGAIVQCTMSCPYMCHINVCNLEIRCCCLQITISQVHSSKYKQEQKIANTIHAQYTSIHWDRHRYAHTTDTNTYAHCTVRVLRIQ